MKNISADLKSNAVSLGLCEKWTNEWNEECNKEELIKKFKRGIDFCLKHNFPSVDYMKENFGDVLNKNGIYADEKFDITSNGTIVANGNCEGKIVCENPCEIYVRHNSSVSVEIYYDTTVWINALDYSQVKVKCGKHAKAYVHVYGDCNIDCEGYKDNVIIKTDKGKFGESRNR